MRLAVLSLASLALFTLAPVASARGPVSELAGVRVGMPEDRAHAALARHGTRGQERAEREREDEQETWTLRGGPWATLAFGVSDARVRWVTAFARTSGPRVRFRDVGPVAAGHRSGRYYVRWQVAASGGTPAYAVIARGTDSTYVTSVSLDGREAAAMDSSERR